MQCSYFDALYARDTYKESHKPMRSLSSFCPFKNKSVLLSLLLLLLLLLPLKTLLYVIKIPV